MSAYDARLTWRSLNAVFIPNARWLCHLHGLVWCKHPSECIGLKITFWMAHGHGAASTQHQLSQYFAISLRRHELPTAALQDGQSQLPEAALAASSQGFPPQWDRLLTLELPGLSQGPLSSGKGSFAQLWACHYGSSSWRLAMVLQGVLDLPAHTLYCRQHSPVSSNSTFLIPPDSGPAQISIH